MMVSAVTDCRKTAYKKPVRKGTGLNPWCHPNLPLRLRGVGGRERPQQGTEGGCAFDALGGGNGCLYPGRAYLPWWDFGRRLAGPFGSLGKRRFAAYPALWGFGVRTYYSWSMPLDV